MRLLISMALLLTVLVESGYCQELVGKTFWCTKYETIPDCDKAKNAPHKIVNYELWKGENDSEGTGFYEIEMNGVKDWVSKTFLDQAIQTGVLVPYDPIQKQKDEALKARQAEAKRAAEAKAAQAKREAIRVAQIKAKNWPSEIEQAVIERKIRMGMTAEQATLAWGKPPQVNKTVGSWGVHEQWVYHSGAYLYFENGVLTSWQTSHRPQ
jgi:hypothetical protein